MAGWYFLENGAQAGPVSDEELLAKAAHNELHPDDLVWQAGMPDWVPVSTVVDIEESGGGKAPPPALGSKTPAPAPSAAVVASPAAANSQTAGEEWFYNNDGERDGPLSILELGELYKSRKLAKTDLVWSASLGDWTAASEVEALAPYKPVGLAAPPKKSARKKSGGAKKKKGIVIAKSKTKISTSKKSKIAGFVSTGPIDVDEPAAKPSKKKSNVAPKKTAKAVNPYRTPATSAGGPSVGFGGDHVDSISIDYLSRSRVWVIIMAVFNLIGAAVFIAFALFSLIIGVIAAFSSGKFGALLVVIPVGLLYLGIAYLVGYPGRRLLKYAAAIRRLELSRDKKDLRDAMDAQRAFWMYSAVMTLIAVFILPVFYFLVAVVGISLGALR